MTLSGGSAIKIKMCGQPTAGTIIELQVQKKPIFTCELCGKKDETVDIICGGPFNHLCPKCHELAAKVIDAYLKMIVNQPLRLFIGDVVKR